MIGDLINQVMINSLAFGLLLGATFGIFGFAINLVMGFLSKVA